MARLDKRLGQGRQDHQLPLLMGILNVTPDSFYDGGQYNTSELALEHARTMVDSGVDVIDVGGESTRPGADPISVEQEKDRVLPVVSRLVDTLSVPVSIDTSKASVADDALRAGASMVNDVTGLEDPEMRSVVSDQQCYVCIMHMQGTPQTMQDNPTYESVVKDVKGFLKDRANTVVEAGLDPSNIILDPGIGFGKTLEHNRRLLTSVESIGELGYPVMIGHSRKSFIGDVLDREVDNRLSATLGVSVDLMSQGVDLLRVHDVQEHSDIRRMYEWLGDTEGDG
ncbi:MAG: dihydropteroate synthase [bacterium]